MSAGNLAAPAKKFKLLDAHGKIQISTRPGKWGGHKGKKIYGRLDCPSAMRWLAKGYYKEHRVFFADLKTARAAGYRPCAICMPRSMRFGNLDKSKTPNSF